MNCYVITKFEIGNFDILAPLSQLRSIAISFFKSTDLFHIYICVKITFKVPGKLLTKILKSNVTSKDVNCVSKKF